MNDRAFRRCCPPYWCVTAVPAFRAQTVEAIRPAAVRLQFYNSHAFVCSRKGGSRFSNLMDLVTAVRGVSIFSPCGNGNKILSIEVGMVGMSHAELLETHGCVYPQHKGCHSTGV